ncbi:hypothetical protein CTA2_9285 [Colletotrichum tanaceti]|uniref:Phosphoglycerate mutase n=1 Tax=Colletotrichum tanaceti TaxID=1306861 RepID=A0A4U6X7D7_9PEZI|nr:hypothetical protein CTA2_9285 [Colletotrichum tanaceti]TKW50943.1 hypothetical protein CTA1_1362 [Colletotrichum tanaceti]
MGRPPAYIFVVRHGARLDAADKKWHLTSPTPYDPPLTYGGWQQAKALGIRIGNILRQAEADGAADPRPSNGRDPSADSHKKRRKFKVVVHSSPFLRCVQTSVAIGAGLAQAPPPGTPSYPTPSPTMNPSASPFILPAAVADDPRPLSVDTNENNLESSRRKKKIRKSTLRLDAFLGEWLSPEYFEMITPPPGSAMMLAGAKADLLRRENISAHDQIVEHVHHHANSVGQAQSQLWNSPKFRAAPERPGSTDSNSPSILGLDNISMTGALPRSRADSTASSSSQRVRFALPEPANPNNPNDGYLAPSPNYALSSSAKIPDGYVAHARDACVSVDYQWDSMRDPLDWGDGGKYGEEWTAMHQRFRKGIQRLVDWYTTAERPAEMVTKTVKPALNGDTECAIDDEDEDDVEPVVILVSHGAGCNALIGAITHQPVLMDVAMASLTVAARKPGRDSEPSGLDTPMSEVDMDPISGTKGLIPVHHYYDLKMFANTEHLRQPVSATHNLSRAPSTASNHSQNGQPHPRGRIASVNTYTPGPITLNPDSFAFPGSRSNSANANLGSMRRTSNNTYSLPKAPTLNTTGITVGSGATSFTKPSPTLSVGLWSPITPQKEAEEEDEDDDIFPDFDHRKKLAPLSKPGREIIKPPTPERKEPQFGGPAKVPHRLQEISRPTSSDGTDEENKIPQLGTFSAGGLWGAPRPLGETEIMRDMTTSKRRWTVNERA